MRQICYHCLVEPDNPIAFAAFFNLCRICYRARESNSEKFLQRDPYIRYQAQLRSLGWVGYARTKEKRKEVKELFDQVINRPRRRMKMIFWLFGVILPRLQKEAAERVYRPGGTGYHASLENFKSLCIK